MTQNTTVAPHAHPVDLIVALTGSERVSVIGFGAEPMPNSWVKAGVRFVGVEETPEGALSTLLEQNKKLKNIRSLIVAGVLVAGVAIGYLGATVSEKPQPAQPFNQITSWTPRSVVDSGVWIDTSSQIKGKAGVVREDGKKLVAIGSKLPNGETLTSVLVDLQTYTTNSSTSMINNAQSRAAPATPGASSPVIQ